jgi:hypothetical protein
VALGKVVALEHLCERHPRGQADPVFAGEGGQPARVEVDHRGVAVEQLEDLPLVGLGVGGDLVASELRARRFLAGRVADHAGEIADQEDDAMPELLEVVHLADHHRVAQVEVGRRRIEADLDGERTSLAPGRDHARLEILRPDDVDAAAQQEIHLLLDGTVCGHHSSTFGAGRITAGEAWIFAHRAWAPAPVAVPVRGVAGRTNRAARRAPD